MLPCCRAGHLGFAVRRCGSKSCYQANLTIKMRHFWARPVKITYPLSKLSKSLSKTCPKYKILIKKYKFKNRNFLLWKILNSCKCPAPPLHLCVCVCLSVSSTAYMRGGRGGDKCARKLVNLYFSETQSALLARLARLCEVRDGERERRKGERDE